MDRFLSLPPTIANGGVDGSPDDACILSVHAQFSLGLQRGAAQAKHSTPATRDSGIAGNRLVTMVQTCRPPARPDRRAARTTSTTSKMARSFLGNRAASVAASPTKPVSPGNRWRGEEQ